MLGKPEYGWSEKVLDERRKHIKDQLSELERLIHKKEELWTKPYYCFSSSYAWK